MKKERKVKVVVYIAFILIIISGVYLGYNAISGKGYIPTGYASSPSIQECSSEVDCPNICNGININIGECNYETGVCSYYNISCQGDSICVYDQYDQTECKGKGACTTNRDCEILKDIISFCLEGDSHVWHYTCWSGTCIQEIAEYCNPPADWCVQQGDTAVCTTEGDAATPENSL